MKIFSKEIKNCANCVYHNFTKNGNDCLFNRKLNFSGVDGIHPDCDFSKNIEKENIENLGFLFNPELNKYQKKTKENTYFLKFHNDISCNITRLQKGEGYIETLFSGTITSKPHLEFILNSIGV